MSAPVREPDCDVAIVGYGPVGQTLAILLARRGHRVTVVEQRPKPYPLPRAVHFDDEIARVLASLGLGPRLAALTEPGDQYDWRNAAGETLLHFDWSVEGPGGWPIANMFCQVELEEALADTAESLPEITVRRGRRAVDLADHGDHAELRVRADDGTESTLRARYVVGCDGANSFVRDRIGTGVTDLGFHFDWLIVDVVPREERTWQPSNLQVCDPARPTTLVSGGPGRRRWEFMRLPGESVEELSTEENVWRLLAPWEVTPGNAVLERRAVYTFQARWADRWRRGRVLIAGDAAHLMPPFAGQGMCSGIRDAANLAWKLDLVLSGRAGGDLLDTYTGERSAHVQNAIAMSVELGNVICLADPDAAAARDQIMLKAGGAPALALPPVPPAVLGPGVLHTGPDGAPVGAAGQPAPQARVTGRDGRYDRLDQIIAPGFMIATTVDPSGVLGAREHELLDRIGAHIVRFVPPETGLSATGPIEAVTDVLDTDGFYLTHLRATGHEVAVVRPDHYLFGAAVSVTELPDLLQELAARLHLRAHEPDQTGDPARQRTPVP